MARKLVNRRELRAETEAAEKLEKESKGKAAPKKTAKRASRAKKKKEEKVVRMKMYWGVFNQSLKRVALYEHSQQKQADQKAADLSTSAKTPHFVQRVKEVIEE